MTKPNPRLWPLVMLALCASPAMASDTLEVGTVVTSIYLSDADSGRLNGIPFRFANVDAPETGGVGAYGGAKCEAERALGFEAKAFMVDLTRDRSLTVVSNTGLDKYDRYVVILHDEGRDIRQDGLDAGHMRPWPWKGKRALKPKPDWCG